MVMIQGPGFGRLAEEALNKLAKWRAFFASWQLGTRTDGDPECNAVKNHRELSMLLRVEANAFTALLIKKGVITHEEFQRQVLEEAEALDKAYERQYPGFSASQMGLHMKLPQALETMKRMNFKP